MSAGLAPRDYSKAAAASLGDVSDLELTASPWVSTGNKERSYSFLMASCTSVDDAFLDTARMTVPHLGPGNMLDPTALSLPLMATTSLGVPLLHPRVFVIEDLYHAIQDAKAQGHDDWVENGENRLEEMRESMGLAQHQTAASILIVLPPRAELEVLVPAVDADDSLKIGAAPELRLSVANTYGVTVMDVVEAIVNACVDLGPARALIQIFQRLGQRGTRSARLAVRCSPSACGQG